VRHHARRRSLTAAAIAVGLLVGAPLALERAVSDWIARQIPPAPDAALDDVLWDRSPVPVTLTIDWQKVFVTVPAETVRSDVTLWREMNFDDWDRIPAPLRQAGLERMWARYGSVVHDPNRWDRMETYEWDWIPQPIRAMAFIEMIRYWSGFYQVGASFGLPRGTVTNTMSAIVMVESWFEHRAVRTNVAGNHDLGLAQVSDATRIELQRQREAGTIDFAPERDEDFLDPWKATRVVALWFEIMLRETRGDLDAAIRAYHRGAPSARRGRGETYLASVVAKRRQYMMDRPSGSPAWDALVKLRDGR
jgi:Transglycosylase SLT domain